jgi:hypothetical protein
MNIFKKLWTLKQSVENRPFSELPLAGVGAEVGSREGMYARKLLKNKRITQLFVIDPFAPYQDEGCWTTYQQQSRYLLAADLILYRDMARVARIFLPSTEAAKQFKPGELDFVYIDANHSYESVKEDVATWFPKVKPGGILGGHDYEPKFPGVVKAVNEFVSGRSDIKLQSGDKEWWFYLKS